MFKKLLLSSLLVIPIFTHADWLYFSEDGEYTTYIDPERITSSSKSAYFTDLESITSSSKSVKYADFWIKMVIHTDITKDGLSVGDQKIVKYKMKCDSNEYAVAAVYHYKKSGMVNNSEVSTYPIFRLVIPDSRAEQMAKFVCGYLYGEHQE